MFSRIARPLAAVSVGFGARPFSAAAEGRLVAFLDDKGAKCWGVAPAGQPKAGDSIALVANPLDGSGPATGSATIASVLPALPIKPPTIICIGLNYKKHADECGMAHPERPVIFMKNSATITADGCPILVPKIVQGPPDELDYEVELGIVIGEDAKDVSKEDAISKVLGYVTTNDVSAREWQLRRGGGGQWIRGKSFDTFCPVGPVLALATSTDGDSLQVSTTLNGTTLQDSNTSDLIFDIATIVSYCSQGTTLEAGTLIITGTPEGVGMGRDPQVWMKDGDVVTTTVGGICSVTNTVVFE